MNAKEWLTRVLERGHLDAGEGDQLLKDCKEERAHIEFKSGLVLDNPARAANKVRDYARAFGNADGGLLVLGFDEKTGVDGVKLVGEASPHAWAGDVLAELASYFSPPPRIVAASADGKELLVIAFSRAPRLIPSTIRGQLAYRFRIGQRNVTAPPWMVSDLVLGRRQQPQLKLAACTVSRSELSGRPASLEGAGDRIFEVDAVRFEVELRIENAGLLDAEEARAGILSWTVRRAPDTDRESNAPAASLLSFVKVMEPARYGAQEPQPVWSKDYARANHMSPTLTAPSAQIAAFEYGVFRATVRWPVFPILGENDPPRRNSPGPFELGSDSERRAWRRGRVRQQCAAFFFAKNSEPVWYQLTVDYERPGEPTITLGAMAPTRPVVAFSFVDPEAK